MKPFVIAINGVKPEEGEGVQKYNRDSPVIYA
jgi:hypothetical protein